jgi:hypothetical protein
VPCVIRFFSGLVLGRGRVLSCTLDPLLAESDQLHLVPLLGQNRVALGLMPRGSLRLVVPREGFSSIRYTHFFFAVFADCRNALAVGAPLDPGFRILSFDPAAILFLFA